MLSENKAVRPFHYSLLHTYSGRSQGNTAFASDFCVSKVVTTMYTVVVPLWQRYLLVAHDRCVVLLGPPSSLLLACFGCFRTKQW